MADVQTLLNQFVKDNEGKCLDFDGYYGCQCMDLVLYWEKYLGLSLIEAPAAVQTWNLNPSGYQKIANGPNNVPLPGDIVVFGTAIGSQYGHIAIVLSATLSGFVSLDQNWFGSNDTVGSPAARVGHNYSAVLGWFHPLLAPKPAAAKVADEAQQQMLVMS